MCTCAHVCAVCSLAFGKNAGGGRGQHTQMARETQSTYRQSVASACTLQHTTTHKCKGDTDSCDTLRHNTTHWNILQPTNGTGDTEQLQIEKQLHPQALCKILQHTSAKRDRDSWNTLDHNVTNFNTQMVRKIQSNYRQSVVSASVEQLLGISSYIYTHSSSDSDYIFTQSSCDSDHNCTHRSCPAAVCLTKWIRIWLKALVYELSRTHPHWIDKGSDWDL